MGITLGPWRIGDAGEVIIGADHSIVVYELNTNEHDARLIAAAPDLLTALKATLEFARLALGCVDFPEEAPGRFSACSEAIVAAEAAIQKAEAQ